MTRRPVVNSGTDTYSFLLLLFKFQAVFDSDIYSSKSCSVIHKNKGFICVWGRTF